MANCLRPLSTAAHGMSVAKMTTSSTAPKMHRQGHAEGQNQQESHAAKTTVAKDAETETARSNSPSSSSTSLLVLVPQGMAVRRTTAKPAMPTSVRQAESLGQPGSESSVPSARSHSEAAAEVPRSSWTTPSLRKSSVSLSLSLWHVGAASPAASSSFKVGAVLAPLIMRVHASDDASHFRGASSASEEARGLSAAAMPVDAIFSTGSGNVATAVCSPAGLRL
mmetsp:Transcript_95825/g.309057  ORF Transcript_95825/g.309057 Transcript_95825/m.309057 type:complete len:223 (-) Transcript_95825:15-683(-)